MTVVVAADETKGTIKSVDTGRKEVVLKGTVSDSIYELSRKAQPLWLDGAPAKLSNLHADDHAVVIYSKSGEHMMATTIRALRKAHEASGTVGDVLGEKREITLKGTIKNTTYELTKDGTVWIDQKRAALSDIHQGDEVRVTYEKRGDRWMANDITVTKRR